jgi:hypothetical protein
MSVLSGTANFLSLISVLIYLSNPMTDNVMIKQSFGWVTTVCGCVGNYKELGYLVKYLRVLFWDRWGLNKVWILCS